MMTAICKPPVLHYKAFFDHAYHARDGEKSHIAGGADKQAAVGMSAFGGKADINRTCSDVRF